MMPAITEFVTLLLLGVGSLFCLLAAGGILLMTDVYNRMQAASKGVTLGATCIVLAAAVHFGEAGIVTRCILVCVFFFVTVPAASHLIARAAYRSGESLSRETTIDEMAQEHDLRS